MKKFQVNPTQENCDSQKFALLVYLCFTEFWAKLRTAVRNSNTYYSVHIIDSTEQLQFTAWEANQK